MGPFSISYMCQRYSADSISIVVQFWLHPEGHGCFYCPVILKSKDKKMHKWAIHSFFSWWFLNNLTPLLTQIWQNRYKQGEKRQACNILNGIQYLLLLYHYLLLLKLIIIITRRRVFINSSKKNFFIIVSADTLLLKNSSKKDYTLIIID